jgi:outer membrane protein OmpA-like peptidoglycan-associated protein
MQLLGPPNKLPNYGDSPCAWAPAEADSKQEEWVKVGFAKAIHPRQVLIGENFNPGSLVAVYLYGLDGKEYKIASEPQLKRGAEPGRLLVLRPQLEENVQINALKIIMNPSLTPGYNQIDALGVSSSSEAIRLGVEIAGDMPPDIKKTALERSVNSKGRENAPVISADGTTLYFTREHPDNIGGASRQDAWVSTLQPNGEWSQAKNMGPPINNAGDNAVLGISENGKTLYLLNSYRQDGTMVEGFSKSHATKSGWSFPVTFFIEDLYNDHQPKNTEMTISPTEDVIILSVQRRDTQGSKDLYVSFKKAAGTWSAPVNLGAVINTADYEGAPFLAADNKTLYFTSIGHRGYGSGDIFVSRRLDDTWLSWSKPLNLGPVINSPGWDSFFTIPASGDFAYMSSFNPASQSDDLYRIPLYPSISPQTMLTIAGRLIDDETGEPIAGEITLKKPGAPTPTDVIKIDGESGEFRTLIPFDSTFILSAFSQGFFPLVEEIGSARPTTQRQATSAAPREFRLYPIRSGQRLPLRQVRFAQSSAELEVDSHQQLLDLVQVMARYPTMEILLEGHTDNQGDFDKNFLLSEERVKSVKEFLLKNGVSPTRIQLKAWGPSRPVSNNLTEETRRQNRRVELTVLKI